MKVTPKQARVVILAVSGLLFLAALPTPALLFSGHPPVRGITTLLCGWWGLITGDIPWFANAAYVWAFGLLLLGFNKCSQLLSAVAIGLGARTLSVEEWYFNEAGGTPVTGLGIAFYLWIGSFVLLLVGAFGLQWLSHQIGGKANPVSRPAVPPTDH